MAQHELHPDARHDLERRQSGSGVLQGAGKKFRCGIERVQARHAGDPLGDLGEQAQHGGGDDAERSLRADDEVLEVVARIVLAQGFQPVPHKPAGEHDFESEGKLPRAAIGEHGHPAGIGGEHAADLGASLGGEAQGEQPAGAGRDLLSLRQRKPRFHNHGVGGEVDVAHPIEPFERDHHLVSALERNLAADEAGIAALRHDRGPRLVGDLKDRRDLPGLSGLEHERRLAAIAVAPFHEIGRHRRLVADGVLRPHDADERIEGLQTRRLMFRCGLHRDQR